VNLCARVAGCAEPGEIRLTREMFRIEETANERRLPDQDIISFGRLREHEGAAANDVVLTLDDPQHALQISRWHFELRRFPDGFRLRPLSDRQTEVDGTPVPKNGQVAVKAGSKVRVARVLTLTFLSPMGGMPGASSLVTRAVE